MPRSLVTADPRHWLAALTLGALLATAPSVAAQATALTLQPEPGLEGLTSRVGRELARRTGREVLVLPSDDPVEARVRVLAAADEAVFAVDGGGAGRELRVAWNGGASRGDAREAALALEALLDRLDAPAAIYEADTAATAASLASDELAEDERPPTQGRAIVLRNADRAPGGSAAPRTVPRLAKPTIYVSLMLGYSPVRNTAIIGPGGGFGLCYGPHCMVVEANLPLVVDERQVNGQTFRYRAVDTGLRLQLRPFEYDDFSLGMTVGILSRIGHAWIVDTDASRTVSNFGVRGSLEGSWNIGGPFEWVVEAGADYAVTRAQYVRYGSVAFLEDRWRPWVVTALRLRP